MKRQRSTSTDTRQEPRITLSNISDLFPADYNPRTWDDAALEQLCESIRKFGFLDPVIANGAKNRHGIVIGGHMRLAAAKHLGHKTVPVVYVDIPDIKQEKELNLRLNRNTGEWDFEKLKAFEMELLLDVGFGDTDLSHIWDDALETEDDQFDEDAELEKIKTPKTKLGDLYQLGSHRLLCGDAMDSDVVKRLVGKNKIDMIYTDVPYNIDLDYNKGISNAKQYGGKTNDAKTDAEYETFLSTLIQNAIGVAAPDAHYFFWCDQKYVGLLQKLYSDLEIGYRRTCLWVKNNANMTPQTAFSKAYEPCVYGVRGSPYLSERVQNLNEVMNKEVGSGNRTIDDIVDLLDLWLCKRLHGSEYEHPTQKPVTLHEKPLRRCTKPCDRVLDLTAGSGSTLIACDQLKRKAFLMEIEPVFCDLIIRRYEAATGNKASLLKS